DWQKTNSAQKPDGSFTSDMDKPSICPTCKQSFMGTEAVTMLNMTAYSRGFDLTKNESYRAVLTKAVGWALAYDYVKGGLAGPEYPARVSIGLSFALPNITDANLKQAA